MNSRKVYADLRRISVRRRYNTTQHSAYPGDGVGRGICLSASSIAGQRTPGLVPAKEKIRMQVTGLTLPERSVKPRARGMTILIDPGLPTHYFQDVVESAAPHIDLVKFGWGTSVITPTTWTRRSPPCASTASTTSSVARSSRSSTASGSSARSSSTAARTAAAMSRSPTARSTSPTPTRRGRCRLRRRSFAY